MIYLCMISLYNRSINRRNQFYFLGEVMPMRCNTLLLFYCAATALLGECVHLLLQLGGVVCLLLEIVALIFERIYRLQMCADNFLDLIVFNSKCA